MIRTSLRFVRRGAVVSLDRIDPNRTLLDYLRLDRRETGTKEGCNEGDCGACTVVLARLRGGKLVYEAVNACILLLGQVDGAEIITIEDLAAGGQLHPIQQAMVTHHGSQCGFCTPGIVMSLFALGHAGQVPVDRAAVVDGLAGNLCRCTGYRPIVDAALAALNAPQEDHFRQDEAQRMALLRGLEDGSDLFLGDETRFFAAPASLTALYDLLRRAPGARLVGGATDVGLWITKKLADIPRVIWLGRIVDFDSIAVSDEALILGGGVRLSDAAPLLARLAPDLGEVMRRFGSVQVRNSGTVGGNIANGSPIGDLAPCLMALGAEVVLAGPRGPRKFPLEAFFIAHGQQDRAGDEVVHSLRIPLPKAGQHICAFKVSKRFDEDISAVMAAFRFEVRGRTILSARIGFGGMAATPRRAGAVEDALAGASLDQPMTWEEAIAALGTDFQPIDDARASGAYRLATARALLQKALFELSGVPTSITRVLVPRAAQTREAQP